LKRSEINRIIGESIGFFRGKNFHLPPFAWIKPDEWQKKATELRGAIEVGLGWDVTDFGLGDFKKTGLLLFTLRNGDPKKIEAGGKDYCEKVIHLRRGQTCPSHYHKSKIEDIINRSGGTLCFELYMADVDGKSYSSDEFSVSRDGVTQKCRPGEVVRLSPGESLTIPSMLYHSFWAEGSDVLCGEVSRVNDDVSDNFFHQEIPRFSEIEEDEEPLYLLVCDLPRFL
jgi:D-lyxose ketol-isomerase